MFLAIEGIDGVGKTTLRKNLVKHYKNQGLKVFDFSLSDLAKYGLDNTLQGISLEEAVLKEDIENKIKDTLIILEELKSSIGNKAMEIYNYNRLMVSYFELAAKASPFLKKLIENGYIVIADRWTMSSLAYNACVKKTYVSRLLKTGKEISYKYSKSIYNTPFIRAKDNNKVLLIERHNEIAEYLSKLNQDVLTPDYVLYIYPNKSMEYKLEERLKARGDIDKRFEDNEKQERVASAYKSLYYTHLHKSDVVPHKIALPLANYKILSYILQMTDTPENVADHYIRYIQEEIDKS